MNAKLISVMALALTTKAGFAATVPAAVSPQTDDFTPMTNSERLGAYVTDTYGPKTIARSAAHAGLGIARGTPKEWGGGVSGFGARMSSGLAQHIVRGTLKHGAAALLHEDNRYRPSGRTGFWKRAKYSVASTFLARHDNGRRGFAFSRIGSAGGAAFISRAWMPRTIATAGAGASSFGITIAADVGINMLHEFWPDLKRKLGRK